MSTTTPVPLLDLSAQYAPLREQILATITRVCDSQRFIMGPEITSLESELATRIGVKHAVAVSSGTDALLLALMALDIGPGDEVVTTTYSFFATAGAISRVGATPVLVDIDPVTYNIDPEALAAAMTARTKAVLPVHLYGLCADMDRIVAVANRAGVPIIEDAAQAIGSLYKGSPAGGMSAFGCFSFFPSKNLGAFGDAGLVTTNDAALAKKAQLLRMHGMEPKYIHHLVGGNFRCDALQAAILRVKAPHLAAWTEARRLNARRYATLFRDAGLLDRVVLPVEPQGSYHIYNQFVVRVPRRNELKAFLDARGIGNEIYYPVPFHRQACFASLGHPVEAFPVADAAAARVLALPVFPELTLEQQPRVVAVLADALRA